MFWCKNESLIIKLNTNCKVNIYRCSYVVVRDHVLTVSVCFSELTDDDNSSANMYRAVAELPKANRDTLAFLMLHLHR